MLVKGNKIVQRKEINGFNFVGNEFYITNISEDDGIITFKNDSMGKGVMTIKEFEEYFELVEEPKDEKFISLEGVKVIRNGRATIVILPDGSKGISKCLPEDKYSSEKGFDIAYTKAEIKALTKKLKQLCK